MSNFAWVLTGAVAAGRGGAAAGWAAYAHANMPADQLAGGLAWNGWFGAFAGALLSVGRGGPAGLAGELLKGAGLAAYPVLLFLSWCAFAPGAVGGLVGLAVCWSVLWACGVRTGRRRAGEPGRDAEPGAAPDRRGM